MSQITYRIGKPGEEAQILDFANYVFGHDHRPHDFRTLLPKVYDTRKQFAGIHYVAEDDMLGLRAMLCVLPVTFHIVDIPLQVGLVGTVSVHPYARGEGHMKRLMSLMLDDQKRKGTDLLCLGGQRQRYGYFGFDHAGEKYQFSINRSNIRHTVPGYDPNAYELRRVEDEQDPLCDACYRLYEQQMIHGARPKEEYLRYARSWDCRMYAVMKNGDFRGELLCTDWDEMPVREILLNDERDLFPVLAKWFETHPETEEIRLSVAPYEIERIANLNAHAESWASVPGQMTCILNFEKTIRASMRLQEKIRPLEDGGIVLKIDEETLLTKVRNGISFCSRTKETPAYSWTSSEAQKYLFMNAPDPEHSAFRYKNWFTLPLMIPETDHF